MHAARIVAKLPESFNAIHVRRNDFQYKDIRHLPVSCSFEYMYIKTIFYFWIFVSPSLNKKLG